MNRYRITCDEGDEYEISADHIETADIWIKFYEVDRIGIPKLIAMVSNHFINNVQLVDDEGKASRIKVV